MEFITALNVRTQDKSLREKFGVEGRKKVEKTFDLEKSIDNLEKTILSA